MEFTNTNVQIVFRVATPHGEYQDALYIPLEEYSKMEELDIEAMKQARVDNWIAVVTAPPVEEIIEGAPVTEPEV